MWLRWGKGGGGDTKKGATDLHCVMRWGEGCSSALSLGLCRGQAGWFLLAGATPTPKLFLLQLQSSLLYQSPAASLGVVSAWCYTEKGEPRGVRGGPGGSRGREVRVEVESLGGKQEEVGSDSNCI